MYKSLSRILIQITTAGALALGGVGVASADNGVPSQVWFGNLSPRTEKLRMQQYGQPKFASPTSRLEPELAAQPRSGSLADLPKINQKMQALTSDPAKVEALLGKGYTVVQVHKTPREVWDDYRDTKDGQLAADGASLRARTENGTTQLNFKPPTAIPFANGMRHRIELGNTIPEIKGAVSPGTMSFLRNKRLIDNPVRELPKLYGGRDVGEFFERAVEIKQLRTVYEIHKNGVKTGEMTVDHVTARDANHPAKSYQFPSVEIEGDHITTKPTAAQLAKLQNTTWKGPHKAWDTLNPALLESPEVVELHRVAEIFNHHLDLKPRDGNKYVQARRGLGIATSAKMSATAQRARRLAQGTRVGPQAAPRTGRAQGAPAPRAARR